ncbi:hypothetical protein BGZ83_001820 [Gryganskiella cystojenkinii]|nr:hypothetical protein BGZ83_001820 [Gryganskiella cystojenkinii]
MCQKTGVTIRKVGIWLLLAMGVCYLLMASTYKSRFPITTRVFSIAILASLCFDVALIRKAYFYGDQFEDGHKDDVEIVTIIPARLSQTVLLQQRQQVDYYRPMAPYQQQQPVSSNVNYQ